MKKTVHKPEYMGNVREFKDFKVSFSCFLNMLESLYKSGGDKIDNFILWGGTVYDVPRNFEYTVFSKKENLKVYFGYPVGENVAIRNMSYLEAK